MLKCDTCGAKMPTEKILNLHKMKRHSVPSDDSWAAVPVLPDTSQPSIPTVTAEAPKEMITIRTDIPVEVIINGRHYSGTEIVAEKEIAEEIKRLVEVSYGKKVFV